MFSSGSLFNSSGVRPIIAAASRNEWPNQSSSRNPITPYDGGIAPSSDLGRGNVIVDCDSTNAMARSSRPDAGFVACLDEDAIQLLRVAGEIRIDRFDPARKAETLRKEKRIASSAFFMKCGRGQTGCRTSDT